MYRPPENRDQQDVSLGDIIERVREGFRSARGGDDGGSGGSSNNGNASSTSEPRRRRIPIGAVVAIIIVAVGVWAATGIYTVGA